MTTYTSGRLKFRPVCYCSEDIAHKINLIKSEHKAAHGGRQNYLRVCSVFVKGSDWRSVCKFPRN